MLKELVMDANNSDMTHDFFMDLLKPQLWSQAVREPSRVSRREPRSWNSVGNSLWPAVDVIEERDQFVIQADVPGVKKEDLKIEILDGHLVLQGSRKRRELENSPSENKQEFKREFKLNQEIQLDRIEAKCEDGVLSVILPKKEKTLPRVIAVA